MAAILKLVPARAPTRKESIIERIKKHPRPNGMLQCPRCGCRTVLTTSCGDMVQNGRYKRGKVKDDRVCAECWRIGIHSPMMPDRIKPAE